jgi:hypothetical protein
MNRRSFFIGTAGLLINAKLGNISAYASDTNSQLMSILANAYPDFIVGEDNGKLLWRDGERMVFDDGVKNKDFETLLNSPCIRDMFYTPYPVGTKFAIPSKDIDPGRVRYEPFFDKMYGNCNKGQVISHLTNITWLPKNIGQPVTVTTVNNVHKKLASVSAELDALPSRFDKYLDSNGTFNCRVIAGTDRKSNHSTGTAIDIASRYSAYWRWNKGPYHWKNSIPMEIVSIFEKHGFIWGGKWYHYDTMHFEYRPELIMAARL